MGVSDVTTGDLDSLLEFVHSSRGFDFTGYKSRASQRVNRRLEAVGAQSYDEYRSFLELHPDEYEQLFNTILINVTSFFRDPEAWDYVATEVLQEIVAAQQGDAIRVWSTGCATGEEAFTLTILLAELLGEEPGGPAEDLRHGHRRRCAPARHRDLQRKQVEPVPEDYLAKYFERQHDDYVFRPEIRRAVISGGTTSSSIPRSRASL